MKLQKSVVIAAGLFCFAAQAMATPIVFVGSTQLKADTANQQITLSVSGGDAVTGFNLRAVLGDGSGAGIEPKFSAISFVTGTIWDAHASTTTGGPIAGLTQDAQASVVLNTAGDSTPATGAFVKLFIDTTGISSGTYALSLTSTEIGTPSRFIGTAGGEITTSITNGTITVPEPSLGALPLAGGVLWLGRRRCVVSHRA